MTPKPPPRLPACTPPADPGSAAVVAHAAESSSGACSVSFEVYADWLQQEYLAAESAVKNLPLICSAAVELRAHERYSRLSMALRVARDFMTWCDDPHPVSVS